MLSLGAKPFDEPDEVREFPNGRLAIVRLGTVTAGRYEFHPGWRWTEHVAPMAGTATCQATHTGYVVSGRLHVVAADGTEGEASAGDVVVIAPGHDAWTVGDEPCVLVDFTGAG